MKPITASETKRLDIRFIPLDSQNPYELLEQFSEESREMITKELHEKMGHLGDELSKTNGHIKIYTQGSSVIGTPQYINFSKEVWDKMHSPLQHIDNMELEVKSATEDYLDRENYTDI